MVGVEWGSGGTEEKGSFPLHLRVQVGGVANGSQDLAPLADALAVRGGRIQS